MPLPRYPNNGEEILLLTFNVYPNYLVMQYKLQNLETYECTVYARDSLYSELKATIGENIEHRHLKLPIWMRVFDSRIEEDGTKTPFRYEITGFRIDDFFGK